MVLASSRRVRERQRVAGTGIRIERLSNADVAKAVSTAKVVRNFFMSVLLWLRLKISERGFAKTLKRSLRGGDCRTSGIFPAVDG